MREELMELNRRLNHKVFTFNLLNGFAIVVLIVSVVVISAYLNKKTQLSVKFRYRIPIAGNLNC